MSQIVNTNENHFMSWTGMGDRNEKAQYARHIPIANALIDKYCTHWWKNHPGQWDYQFLQFKLCLEIDNFTSGRERFYTRDNAIRWCAFHLEVKNLLLHNDPELPF